MYTHKEASDFVLIFIYKHVSAHSKCRVRRVVKFYTGVDQSTHQDTTSHSKVTDIHTDRFHFYSLFSCTTLTPVPFFL